MILFFILYFLRIIISIAVGFMSRDLYSSTYIGSQFTKEKRNIIYHNFKEFSIWLIPVYGWIQLIVKQTKSKDKNIFFNE